MSKEIEDAIAVAEREARDALDRARRAARRNELASPASRSASTPGLELGSRHVGSPDRLHLGSPDRSFVRLLDGEEAGAPRQNPVDPSFTSSSLALFRSNRIYCLIVFVPLALLAEPLEWPKSVSFGLSCLGILPLAGLLGDATEQVASHTSDTLGGLLNATFGNATEVILSFFLLLDYKMTVVKVSLLGSILSNLLLVLGCACFAAGMRRSQAAFNPIAAQANCTLLQIAVLGLVVPALMSVVGQLQEQSANDLLLSRSISIVLLVLYIQYLIFQLGTHRELFEQSPKESERDGGDEPEHADGARHVDEADEVALSLHGSLAWLAVATVLVAILSEQLSGAMEEATRQWNISETFVGFVIIPIIGNAAEHSTAVLMAAKGKMDLAIGVALGSSTQVSATPPSHSAPTRPRPAASVLSRPRRRSRCSSSRRSCSWPRRWIGRSTSCSAGSRQGSHSSPRSSSRVSSPTARPTGSRGRCSSSPT